MAILFFSSIMCIGIILFAGRGKGIFRISLENKRDHTDRAGKIEQKIQQTRDKVLFWGFPL